MEKPDATTVELGTPLSLDLHQEIEGLLTRLRIGLGHECLSEFSFANLFLFRSAHHYRYLAGDYPCILGLTYDGARHLLPLFDLPTAPIAAVEQLLGVADCFYPLPASAVARLNAEAFTWTDARDDADYVYTAESFLNYRGQKLRKKRNLMKQFLEQHTVSVHSLEPGRIADALVVLESWQEQKKKGPEDADLRPCREALSRLVDFGLDGSIYYADGVPAGFLLAESLSGGAAVMRFSKGRDAYKGIYQYMFHRYCHDRGDWLRWLNFEQDLGLENFRSTKLSYAPTKLLGKYRVTLKHSPPGRISKGCGREATT